MDEKTIRKLAKVCERAPRVLFRFYNNNPQLPPYLSGGRQGLKTPTAITPLAFAAGVALPTLSDMPTNYLTGMVQGHLTAVHVPTEFSSFFSSLREALKLMEIELEHAPTAKHEMMLDSIHICIIDTAQLRDSNAIFFVPDLDFLDDDFEWEDYDHEYLVHGVITGAAYRAMPLKVFIDAGLQLPLHRDWEMIVPITAEDMAVARQIGDQYGGEFALPMCLAVLCCDQRDEELFYKGTAPDVIVNGINGLNVKSEWNDGRHMEIAERYPDAMQLHHLMIVLAVHFLGSSIRREESCDEDSDEKKAEESD